MRVTMAGHTYRSTVVVMGGDFLNWVTADVRAATGVNARDEVDVDVELNTRPRDVVVPPDLANALDSDASARRNFEALSYSNRRRLVMLVEDAKTDETRPRRIVKTVALLHEGRA